MGSLEFGSTSGQAEVADAVSTTPLSAERNGPRPHWEVWAIVLAAGVAAGVVSWLVGELTHGVFQPRLFPVEVMGLTSLQPTSDSRDVADFKNATLAFAILGCVTGMAMGFAGGLAGRCPSRGAIVVLGAQALGALVGALASLVLLPYYYRQLVPDLDDFLSPILIQGGIWMAIGAVGGLAFGFGMGCRRLHAAIGGACLGAFLASVLFQLLRESLLPDSGSWQPVASSSIVRLLAMLLVTVLVAVGAARGTLGHGLRPSPSSGH